MSGVILQGARRLDVGERRRLTELPRAGPVGLGKTGETDRKLDVCPRCGGTRLACEGDETGTGPWRGSAGLAGVTSRVRPWACSDTLNPRGCLGDA